MNQKYFSQDHAWALGGFARVFTPPPKAKKLTLRVYRPRNQNQNLTYTYRQKKPQGFFPSPRMVKITFLNWLQTAIVT